MWLGYVLYGIALVLFIYIIVDLIRARKFDLSDAIAALGIMVSILLAPPTQLPNIFGQPTNTPVVSESPQGKLVFDENFDDGLANGITTNNTKWEIIDDNNGGKLFQMNNRSGADWIHFSMSSTVIADATIEYKVKFVASDSDSLGAIACHFRSSSQNRYLFALTPVTSDMSINYQGVDTNNGWSLLKSAHLPLEKNAWYEVGIDVIGNEITVYIDGNKVLTAKDDRLKTGEIVFGIAPNTVAQFDDLRVWAIP